MSDVVNKLLGFCHTLRHDGIDYGDYIEQLTYLLFLKMADEKSIEINKKYNLPTKTWIKIASQKKVKFVKGSDIHEISNFL